MSESFTALKTVIDLTIIGAFAYAFWVFQKHKNSAVVEELRTDFFLITLGMSLIGLSYLWNLVCLHLLPLLMPLTGLLNDFEFIHHDVMWILASGGTILLALGVAKSILRTSSVISELRASEERVHKIGLEAMTALSKLNESEAELTVQNKRFHAMVENLPQGICMYDEQQRLIVCNERYASIYGLSKNLLSPGMTFRQILDHRIKNKVYMGSDPEKYIEERLAAVALVTTTTKIHLLSDGRVFAIAHRPLTEGGWVGTHEDITELAKAEAMNQRLASIVEDAINEIYVFDAISLKFIQVNVSACKNLGYSMSELRELTPMDIEPEFTRETFEENIAPLRTGQKTHIQFDTVHRRKDDTLYEVKVTLQQIRSQNQKVFAAIIEDVTDRKEAEHNLKQSEELFSKAFQSNPVPFSISGPDGTIYDLNESWLTSMGYTREEAIGNSSLKLGVWADPNERARFVELLKEESTVNNYETQYRTKNGELRDMIVSGEWVKVREEPRLFNISHDVTERKAAERKLLEDRDTLQELVNDATADLKTKAQELEAALTKEKELNELQRQFVSMASHEFRTPLAIIDSTAQRLKKNAGRMSSEEALMRVDKIRDAVVRMTRLMESTLNAARLDDGKITIEIGDCNVKKVVRDTCSNLQELAKNHNINYETSDLPQTIKADAGALDQVLTNLLSNAIKYSPGTQDIKLRAFVSGDDIILKINDHGIGIDEDDLPKMFGKYFRAKTSVGIAGTGIGLYLTKTLVEMHGGSISIQSKRGEGSTFTVSLPIAGPSRAEQAA